MIKLTKILNILVQRRAAIGDVIMTTGVVRELKKKYGANANIYVATDSLDVYKNNPHVAGVMPMQAVDSSRFDVVYNLDDAYELNPYTNYIDAYFYRVFGDRELDKSVELFPTTDDVNNSPDFGNKYIVAHMRNWHWAAKNVDMAVWFEVYARLFEHAPDLKIVATGGATDHFVDHPNFVDARDKYTVQQLKLICDGAACFVGIDSAPYHCAAASTTHIISLLTHLLPERIVPYRKWQLGYNSTSIQTLEDCAGCNDRQQRPIHQIICEKGNYPCTSNFDADAIAQAIIRTLS
jgi:ADP-heptose:LPS heptosyltransferase